MARTTLNAAPDPADLIRDTIHEARSEPDALRQHHLATFASAVLTGHLEDHDGTPASHLLRETADRLLQRAKLSDDPGQAVILTREALNVMDEALLI